MGKKKDKTPVVNHIRNVNVEIDYDKLAEAILKAQEKQSSEYSVTREWMKFLVTPVLWGIAVITGMLGIAFVWQSITKISEAFSESMTAGIINALGFVMGLFFVGVAFFTGASAREINKENDKNFVVAVFSGIVSLVALVVSFIALIQGVS